MGVSVPGARQSGDRLLFTLAGVPVWFSPSFVFLVWFAAARAPSLSAGLRYAAALTFSVLVHEFGHALAARHYRLRPSILIHGAGGYCLHEEARRRNDDAVVTAAGPAAGAALGLAAWLADLALSATPAHALLGDLVWIGAVGTVMNLLPVLPLDGGSLWLNLLERSRRVSSPLWAARATSVVVGSAAAVYGLWNERLWLVVLFGYLVWRSASELGWLSAEGLAQLRPLASLGRPWWRPTPVVGGALAAIVLTGLVGGATLAYLPPLLFRQPWSLLTWPLASGGGLDLLAAAVLWLVGPEVEERRGRRWLGGLLVASVVVPAAAAALVGWLGADGVLVGPTPVALAVAMVWARVGQRGSSSSRGAMVGLAVAATVGMALAEANGVAAAAELAACGVALAALGRASKPPASDRRGRPFRPWRG